MAAGGVRAYTEVMRASLPTVEVLIAAALAACSTPASRIRGARAAFDAYPPRVQEAIRAGRVELGFTREQTTLALGRPDWITPLRAARAREEEWTYRVPAPFPARGMGVGDGWSGWGPSAGERLGVFAGAREDAVEEPLRVLFEDGVVIEISRPEDRGL